MSRFKKRVAKLEERNSPSYERIAKEYQKVFMYKIHIPTIKGEEVILTERDKRICKIHEQMVRADPMLYENSLYRILDRRKGIS